ncbi:MAG TPA: extracellular solute-binding protein [Candidatus Binatia bacterium]|jgi:iron(III) transport system substrate-binding protein
MMPTAVRVILFSLGLLAFNPTARADWKQDWEKTVAAAEKEGEVVLYGQGRVGISDAIKEFSKAYPKIRLNFVSGQGSELAKKIMAEKRADKHLVDLAVGGGGTMVLVYHKAGLLEKMSTAFILPEVSDPSRWWAKKHHYADPDQAYVFMAQGDVDDRIGAYNKNLLKPAEVHSWWDVLEPKWKGKIVMSDPKWAGNIGSWRYLYYSPELGPKFIRRFLAEANPVFSTDERQMIDWLANGKYAMYLLAKDENIEQAVKQGLSIETLRAPKDGGNITTGSGHISFFQKAPHPNAARVYLNWFLSRDGQLAWQKYTLGNSLRNDIPKDMLPQGQAQVPKEGRSYMMTSLPQYEDVQPLRKLVDEVLAKRGK